MNKSQRAELLHQIDAEDFAVHEAVLYLNTHPTDAKALKFYAYHRDCLAKLVTQYTDLFGPLTADNVNVKNKWTWATDPWPWEMEDCK